MLKKKKINKKHRDTQTHPHTNKPKRINNKERSVLTGTIEAHGSRLIGACGYGSLPDRCLCIGAVEIGACLIGACDRDGVD